MYNSTWRSLPIPGPNCQTNILASVSSKIRFLWFMQLATAVIRFRNFFVYIDFELRNKCIEELFRRMLSKKNKSQQQSYSRCSIPMAPDYSTVARTRKKRKPQVSILGTRNFKGSKAYFISLFVTIQSVKQTGTSALCTCAERGCEH